MSRCVRLTPLGAAIIGLLAAAVVALIVGSHTLQPVGFVVALIVVLVLVADNLPRSARPDRRGAASERGAGHGRGAGFGRGAEYGRGRGARPGPPTEHVDDSTR